MRKQLLHREDELRALNAVHTAQQAMLRAETDIVHRKLAQYKGEQLEGLDVKTLGVLLAEMDAARTRVEAARQRKLLTSCPDDFVCPITQELMVDPHVCADGQGERGGPRALLGLERHERGPVGLEQHERGRVGGEGQCHRALGSRAARAREGRG